MAVLELVQLDTEKLRIATARGGMTRSDVASRAGLCRATVSAAFGRRFIGAKTARRIAAAVKTPLRDLLVEFAPRAASSAGGGEGAAA